MVLQTFRSVYGTSFLLSFACIHLPLESGISLLSNLLLALFLLILAFDCVFDIQEGLLIAYLASDAQLCQTFLTHMEKVTGNAFEDLRLRFMHLLIFLF
jgi:hypothetical protein